MNNPLCTTVAAIPEFLPAAEYMLAEEPIPDDYYLMQNAEGIWQLCKMGQKAVEIDFAQPYYRYRGGVEYLPKAFKKLSGKKILDATAGWARDAWLLAYRGYHLTLCEKNPYLYTLLAQGIARAQNHPAIQTVAKNLSVTYTGSQSFIRACGHQFDAIYLDPMFPQRQKSAKVKKDMQILHDLLGSVADVENDRTLLESALDSGCEKVVVKRPKDADFLAQIKPHHSIHAPNTRFDIY